MARTVGPRVLDGRTKEARAARRRALEGRAFEQAFDVTEFRSLPDVPDTKDWHYLWVDTSDPRNVLKYRDPRVGYEPVPPDSIPEYIGSTLTLKDGQFSGFVGVREMVLHRVPQARYAAMMARDALKADAYDAALQGNVEGFNRGEKRARVVVEQNDEGHSNVGRDGFQVDA
jgi:hypothetical protein